MTVPYFDSLLRPSTLAATALALTLARPAPVRAAPPIIAFTSPTSIDEGEDVVITISVTDPDGDTPTWAWDLDGDMAFDDLPGEITHTIAGSETDGPTPLRVGVRATDGTEVRTVYRTIRVDNVAPEITSFPLTSAAVRRPYAYDIAIDEPAGDRDPLEIVLIEAPSGMDITGSSLAWTPTVEQRGTTFDVEVRVRDGDGGEDTQAWSIAVAANNPPSGPVPAMPTMRDRVALDEPVTLTVTNGADPDDDPLVYFFRLARTSTFEGSVVSSGEVDEGAGETTSWTTTEPLEPGLWYWEVWASDGIEETPRRYAHLVVGSGTYPDAGPIDAGPPVDASLDSLRPSRGGCAVGASGGGSGLLVGLALMMALGLLVRARRQRASRAAIAVALAAMLALVGCTDRTDGMSGPADAGFTGDDQDGDTISDEEEGSRERVDTDGDLVPDFLDPDSDGDGISDFLEAGDASPATAARDSDRDGVPDFRDLDSDDNGIPDALEEDTDGDLDGIADYADLDDDNDLVRDGMELEGVLTPATDTDGDGDPNFRDPDSDDDLILDGDEFLTDTDGDGLRDFEDDDSDNDGIPDREEAGDDDLYSPPRNSDDDDIPDFRDPDSDNDGLSDAAEREGGTDPTSTDSDDDGVTDLIEVGAGTDPLDGDVSPRTRGDFVFVVPFEEDPDPARDTLSFRTALQLVDIYFLFDISGSMSVEVDSLRTAVSTLVGDITCRDFGTACEADADCATGQACSVGRTCIEDPSISACIASPWTGAGIYETQLENLLSLQPDPAATSTALAVDTFGATENLFRAVWTTGDPMSAPGSPMRCATPMPGFVGCPAFREEAARILVAFTDEDSDGTETVEQAATALRDADITFIGVWSGTAGSTTRSDLVDLATASGSLSGMGAPLVFDGADAAVVPAVSSAITEVVQGVPIRVTISAADEPDDAGDALQFIDYLEVNTTDPTCTAIGVTEDTDGDGRADAFPSLLPGTPVCWDVVPLRNDTVEPAREPLVFRARLTVSGDGSPLDSRIVYFLVPPVIPPPDIPI